MIEVASSGRQTETPLRTRQSWTASQPEFDPSMLLDQQQAKTAFPFPLTYLYRPEVRAPGRLNRGRVSALLLTAAFIFVGYDAGEWGGGLQRIDRTTGVVANIDDVTDDPCGGQLNPACDPVTGIATIPWKPDCIAVAIGLMHMLGHGRTVEVCDTAVRLLYERRASTAMENVIGQPRLERTLPFFGLQHFDGTLLTAAKDGLYQIGEDGLARQLAMPQLQPTKGIALSFDIPGVILVQTNTREHFSMPPLLIPR